MFCRTQDGKMLLQFLMLGCNIVLPFLLQRQADVLSNIRELRDSQAYTGFCQVVDDLLS